MNSDEKADILTMLAAGYSQAEVSRMLDRDARTIAGVVAEYRKTQREKHEDKFHQLYIQAAEVAATNGDHKPALEWLDRMGAIPETSRQRTQLQAAQIAADAQRDVTRHLAKTAGGHGPTVNIGIGLPSQLGAASPEIRVFDPNECPEKVTKTGEILPTLQHKVGRVLQGAEDTGEG